MTDNVRRLKDTRIWQYRAAKDAPDGVEKRIFPSRGEVPAGEGWFDSTPEAQAGAKLKPAKPEKPLSELSVKEQVAQLEAKAAREAAKTAKEAKP